MEQKYLEELIRPLKGKIGFYYENMSDGQYVGRTETHI